MATVETSVGVAERIHSPEETSAEEWAVYLQASIFIIALSIFAALTIVALQSVDAVVKKIAFLGLMWVLAQIIPPMARLGAALLSSAIGWIAVAVIIGYFFGPLWGIFAILALLVAVVSNRLGQAR